MKNRTAPDDQLSREAIVQETEKNVFVQASAGTGKTTLMVDRVVELVRKGIPLDKLAVVTFTNPAAAELRIRIRDKLRVESRNGSTECSRALKVFSSAWISTIHGFASRILKEYFNYAGVDPSFSITETHFTPVEINREWDRWLLEFDVERPGHDTEVLIKTDTQLQKEIALGIERRRWLISPDCIGGTYAELSVLDDFIAKEGLNIEEILGECSNPSDTLFGKARQFLEELRELRARLPELSPEEFIKTKPCLNLSGGSVKNWEDLKHAKKIFKSAKEQFKRIVPVLKSGKLTEQTWDFAFPFAKGLLSKWDSDRSRLSYNDLLYLTWKAIARSRKLANCLSDKFDHILIDEFQDTSSEQTALFEAFLEQEDRLPDGCITVVADDKQSIYGWRNADIETYNDFRERLEKSGALSKTITTNFRSSRNIIRFVNSFGSQLFLNQTDEEDPFGCGYSLIEPRPGAPEGEPVRIVTLPEIPEVLKNIYNKNAYDALLQAEWLADYVKNGLKEGNNPEDYALLYRSGTHLHHFIDVLEREGIPYYVRSSRDFLKRPEINDLKELIRCLLYPADRMAWIHTLRSLFFGISDNVINSAVLSGSKGYVQHSAGYPNEVQEANGQLRRFRRSILAIPLADFLFELLFQTEMIPVIAAVKYQETRRLGNLQYILEQVFSGEILSPVELLHNLDERLAPERTEEPSSIPAEGGAVTVSTIHGAKGLAWKHVIVSAMPTRSYNRSRKVISYDHRKIAAFSLGVSMDTGGKNKMKSPFWPEITGIGSARERAELRRLIYVAVTRPRDSLVVLAKPVDQQNKSDGAILWESLQSAIAADPGCCVFDEILPVEHFPASSPGKYEIEITDDISAANEGNLFEVNAEPEGWQRRGAEIGDCVHAVMEKIDFKSPELWFEENEKHLRKVYKDDFGEVRRLCLNYFDMELPFDTEKMKILGREYPYFVKAAGGMKKRYIDLLLRCNGKLTVVDYKTDTFDGTSAEEVVESYIEKQRYYLQDISEIFDEQTCGYLVFLREKVVFSVPPV